MKDFSVIILINVMLIECDDFYLFIYSFVMQFKIKYNISAFRLFSYRFFRNNMEIWFIMEAD